MLEQLTEIATFYDPAIVGKVVLEHLATVVGGCIADDLGTAESLFGWLIEEAMKRKRRG
jgi:hypothetical protein